MMNDISDFGFQMSDSFRLLRDCVKFVVKLLHGIRLSSVVVQNRTHFGFQFGDATVLIVVQTDQFVNLRGDKQHQLLYIRQSSIPAIGNRDILIDAA